MLLKQMFDELRGLVDAGISVQIASSPGAGKSEGSVEWVKRQSEIDGFAWGKSTTMLATQSPVDLLGYLLPGYREVTNPETGVLEKVRISEFTMPVWYVSDEGIPLSHYKRAMIILEEADKCEADVTKTSAEIRLNRSLGPWKLDKYKVGCISLVNRVEDRSGSGKRFDFIINRQAEFEILADVEGWRDW